MGFAEGFQTGYAVTSNAMENTRKMFQDKLYKEQAAQLGKQMNQELGAFNTQAIEKGKALQEQFGKAAAAGDMEAYQKLVTGTADLSNQNFMGMNDIMMKYTMMAPGNPYFERSVGTMMQQAGQMHRNQTSQFDSITDMVSTQMSLGHKEAELEQRKTEAKADEDWRAQQTALQGERDSATAAHRTDVREHQQEQAKLNAAERQRTQEHQANVEESRRGGLDQEQKNLAAIAEAWTDSGEEAAGRIAGALGVEDWREKLKTRAGGDPDHTAQLEAARAEGEELADTEQRIDKATALKKLEAGIDALDTQLGRHPMNSDEWKAVIEERKELRKRRDKVEDWLDKQKSDMAARARAEKVTAAKNTKE